MSKKQIATTTKSDLTESLMLTVERVKRGDMSDYKKAVKRCASFGLSFFIDL